MRCDTANDVNHMRPASQYGNPGMRQIQMPFRHPHWTLGALLGFILLGVFLFTGPSSASKLAVSPARMGVQASSSSASTPMGGETLFKDSAKNRRVLGLIKDVLNGGSSDNQPANPDTVQIFKSDCTTVPAATDFHLGDTVCGKISNIGGNTRRFNWEDANRDIVFTGPTFSVDPTTSTFVLPSTSTSPFGGTTVDNRGQWTLQSIRNTNFNVQGSTVFYVSQTGSPVASLSLSAASTLSGAANTDFTYAFDVVNHGPDAATNATLTVTIPPNTTFVSMVPGLNGAGWVCGVPGGSPLAVTCTKSSMDRAPGSNPSQQEEIVLTVHVPTGTPINTHFTPVGTVSSDVLDIHPEDNKAFAAGIVSSGGNGPAIDFNSSTIMNPNGESCFPNNSAVDPGETVTIQFCVQNDGNETVTNLVGTLQNTNGVTNASGPVTYGTIGGAGGTTCKFFTFIAASLPCGSALVPTITFTGNSATVGVGANLGAVSFHDASSPVFPMASNTNGYWTSQTVVPQCCNAPSAAESSVSGRITRDDGTAVEGAVVNLSGSQNRLTITDANGNYKFDDVETNGFYTVTPSRANFGFTPVDRSFSQLGNHTDAAFTGSFTGDSANPSNTTEYFVRQHYLDFLGREPDQGGFEYWTGQINQCNGDANCIRNKRIDVSAAFFASPEFQQTGSFIYELYAGALGRTPNYTEFMPDRSQVIGGPNLEAARVAFTDAFVQRSEFIAKYPVALTRDQFVDALIQTMTTRSGADVSALRDTMLSDYDAGGRSLAVRDAVQANAFVQAEYNKAFVLFEYFAYLRRNPDTGGYDFWLDVLNGREAGNYRGMVCAFITSSEYQMRFSSVVTHSNSDCSGVR